MTPNSPIGYWEAFAVGLLPVAAAIAILPWLDRKNVVTRAILIGLCVFLAWRYMLWRITDTLPPVGLTLDFGLGVLFTTVEFFAMIGATISLFFLTRTRNRTPEADRNIAWLKSLKKPPLVDVLICTYNEEAAILERTMIGALGIAYPNYRVWICDDGHRPWLKRMCERNGCGYITRDGNENAKAGNINNALSYLSTLPERPEFVSILDADFVAKSNFLERTVALMRDPDVGIVQTPQHFYNADPIQRNLSLSGVWPDEQRFFFDVVMASKDAWGGAFCCGTSSLLRFAPLMQIKKFPTDSVTEDYLVTLRLATIGYRTIYLNEPLSLGLAPEGLKEHVSQRSRWALGFIQICRGPSGPLSLTSGASFLMRVMLVETFLFWSATHAFRLLGILVPAAFLLLGIQAVYAHVPDAIYHLLPYLTAEIAVMSWMTNARILPIMGDLAQLLVANDIAKSVLVGLFKPKGHKFKVTAKGGDRTKRFIQWPMLRVFLAYLALTVAGIVWTFFLNDDTSRTDASAIALYWSWYNIIILALACFVCVEAPQYGAGQRFRSAGRAALTINGHKYYYDVSDISVAGLRVRGPLPDETDTTVRVDFDGLDVDGKIVRAYEDGFAISFDRSKEAKERVVRHVYGGKYGGKLPDISPGNILTAMLNRVLR
jgi:cellulose synthase/poly-beta-1,6-N-acetylglucosamine synthase-like glycosyltransferase